MGWENILKWELNTGGGGFMRHYNALTGQYKELGDKLLEIIKDDNTDDKLRNHLFKAMRALFEAHNYDNKNRIPHDDTSVPPVKAGKDDWKMI